MSPGPPKNEPSLAPPSGGFGVPSVDGAGVVRHEPRPPQKSSHAKWLLLGAAAIAACGAALGVGLGLADKPLGTAEGRNTLTQIGERAASSYARNGRVCPSASVRVPAAGCPTSKYQSTEAEWTVDASRNAGFSCLGFGVTWPSYWQYEYTATANGFVARARTCVPELEPDKSLELRGHVVFGRMFVGKVSRVH